MPTVCLNNQTWHANVETRRSRLEVRMRSLVSEHVGLRWPELPKHANSLPPKAITTSPLTYQLGEPCLPKVALPACGLLSTKDGLLWI